MTTLKKRIRLIKELPGLEQIEDFILILIAFLLPLYQKPIVILITLLGVLAVYRWVRQGVKKLQWVYWPFIILFIAYAIGLLFTSNFDYGFKDLETRSTFALFPLFFGLTKRDTILPLKGMVYALVLGCILAIGFSFYFANICFQESGYPECYEGARLSYHMHPTYFALYLITAATFLLIDFFGRERSTLSYFIVFSIVIIFLVMVYRLYSLGPYVALVALIGMMIYAYFHFKALKKYFLIGLLVIVGLVWVAAQNLSFLKHDVEAVKTELSGFYQDREAYVSANKDNTHSISARILIWNTSAKFISENPFGVGTGDVKDELIKYYRANGMDAYADKKLNPHCQYLQTAGSIGVISMLFLIGVMFYYLIIGFRERNYYLIALITLFSVACLFESVLERQWGILFFMFFLMVAIRAPEAIRATNE